MQQHKGPDVPHRTPRTRALEIGTTPEGFDDKPVDPDTGMIRHPQVPGGPHIEQKPSIDPSSKTIDIHKPFTVK
jgi:hypothetical protein